MANPRLGLYDGSVIAMFPRRLLNTAVSPTLLQASDYARKILNLIPNSFKAGSGAKRYGVGAKGDAIGANIVDLFEFRDPSGSIEILAYCDDGSIRRLNEGTGAWTSLKTGLTTGGTPRWVAFNSKLIIADGVNNTLSYDGSTCDTIKEFVIDFKSAGGAGLATAASQTDTNTITVTVGAGRSDYSIGQRIKVKFATTGYVTATISNVSGSSTKTIDVSGTPFPNPTETIQEVYYEKSAPILSDIYVEHDRLWGLSPGAQKASDFRGSDGMKVYYTDATNNEAAWYNEDTEEVGYVNLINKSQRFDELVKISSIDGNMVFFSRLSTFIYAGDDPTALGEFTWVKTIPVGCINGSLVQKYPSDVLFFTRYGARSLRTVFQTEGTEAVADLGSAVDPTITGLVDDLVGSDAVYKAARSFFYERDGFYGYQLGGTYCMVYALSEESKGWVYFGGAFADASAYLGTSDGRLLVAVGDQLHAYANGTDSDIGIAYDDDGEDITVEWQTPWMHPKNGRWANVGFELMMEEVCATTVDILRAYDTNDGNIIPIVTGIDLTDDNALWDVDQWDEGLWDGVQKRIVVRDKFLKDSFSLTIKNVSGEGPLSFLGVKPIGR